MSAVDSTASTSQIPVPTGTWNVDPVHSSVDGGKRRTKARRCARFDFNENDDVAVARDNVDLAAGQPHVACDHRVPGIFEESHRSVFTFTTEPCSSVYHDMPGKSWAASRTRQNPRRWAAQGPWALRASMCR